MTNYITKTIKNGVEANIPVTSVNGQYGDVTIQTGGNYIAGDGIEIKNGLDYSAMRGPCDEGYHIPSESEAQALADAMTALGLNDPDSTGSGKGTNWETYLKMPIRYGYRNTAGTLNSGNDTGFYWTCTPYGTNQAKALFIDSDGGYIQPEPRAYGCLIRPFKDTIEIPTSSWTTLYDGSSVASGAGIFYNSTDGIISISSDGVNRISISDKNVRASGVYNAQPGYSCARLQWGNNFEFDSLIYGFQTSSTQVNATGYGPGCYYRNAYFRTGNNDWSSVQNDNLWGGVTGAIQRNNEIINKSYNNIVNLPSTLTIQSSIDIMKSENTYGAENTTIHIRRDNPGNSDDDAELYLKFQGIYAEDGNDAYGGDTHVYAGTMMMRGVLYYVDLRFLYEGNGTWGLYQLNAPTLTFKVITIS